MTKSGANNYYYRSMVTFNKQTFSKNSLSVREKIILEYVEF